jgi:hypothetical protein
MTGVLGERPVSWLGCGCGGPTPRRGDGLAGAGDQLGADARRGDERGAVSQRIATG